MPLVLSEHNTAKLSNEELLATVLADYASESNYESYEKDYGNGAIAERSPWITRDKGDHARRALQIIAQRKAGA